MNNTVSGYYPWQRSKQNTLLLKDDVGRSKQTHYDLPQRQFVYGKALPRDKEGAKEVTMTWNFHGQTRDKQPARDFKQLNKMSVGNGLYRATDYSNFRKSTDARVKVQKGKNALPLFIPEEEFRYGKVNRPSTPINLIVGNCYGLEHQMRQQDYYRSNVEEAEYAKPKLLPRGNKATVLSYTYTKQKIGDLQQKVGSEQQYFKLKKYNSVQPRTNTHLKSGGSRAASRQNQSQSQIQSARQQQEQQEYDDNLQEQQQYEQ